MAVSVPMRFADVPLLWTHAGGATRLVEPLDAVVVPAAGQAALFQHKVRHEGEPVPSGTKYALRTDVLCEADEDTALTYEA